MPEKLYVVPHLNHFDLTNATLVSHEQKCPVGPHYNVLKLTNKMVPLTMLSVSHDSHMSAYIHTKHAFIYA